MVLPVTFESSDAVAVTVSVPFDPAAGISEYRFYVSNLADVKNTYYHVFDQPNAESPPGKVTAVIPLEDLNLPDINKPFYIRATKVSFSQESLLSASTATVIDLPDDIIPLDDFDSGKQSQTVAVQYAVDSSSGNIVPITASPDGSGGFALSSTAEITGPVNGTFDLTGDKQDLDTGAGTDEHDIVVVGLPGDGGHLVGGSAAAPFSVTFGSYTYQAGSSVAVGSTAVTGLPANINRKWAILVNSSDEILWLGIGFTPTSGNGIPLFPGGGSFTIDHENHTTQLIEVVSSGGAGKNLFVQEAT